MCVSVSVSVGISVEYNRRRWSDRHDYSNHGQTTASNTDRTNCSSYNIYIMMMTSISGASKQNSSWFTFTQ